VNFMHDTDTVVHLVIDDVRQAEVKRQMDVAKKSSGHLVVHDATVGPDVVFELSAAIKRGEVVILAGDRVRGERKTKVKFLGGDAWFPTTAFSLASAAGSTVCVAWSFRTGMQRYECIGVGPLFDGSKDAAADRAQGFQAQAQNFAARLEDSVRRFPKQWFNFFDFWGEG
jgi:predicted LPLAT superfamily acyltransferase